MSEKRESDSLTWIHAVRKRNYERTKDKSLVELSPEPSAKVKSLVKKLRLQRVPLRVQKNQRPDGELSVERVEALRPSSGQALCAATHQKSEVPFEVA